MHFYRSIGQALAASQTTTMRSETGSRLIDISSEEVLREFAVLADRVMPRLG